MVRCFRFASRPRIDRYQEIIRAADQNNLVDHIPADHVQNLITGKLEVMANLFGDLGLCIDPALIDSMEPTRVQSAPIDQTIKQTPHKFPRLQAGSAVQFVSSRVWTLTFHRQPRHDILFIPWTFSVRKIAEAPCATI